MEISTRSHEGKTKGVSWINSGFLYAIRFSILKVELIP